MQSDAFPDSGAQASSLAKTNGGNLLKGGTRVPTRSFAQYLQR
jgi:hypothetical protein